MVILASGIVVGKNSCMWVILIFVSNPKVVTVFIFGLFFPISLSRTKVDWCKFVLVISLRSRRLMIQKFVHFRSG